MKSKGITAKMGHRKVGQQEVDRNSTVQYWCGGNVVYWYSDMFFGEHVTVPFLIQYHASSIS